jgi:hypothetical protein
LPRFVPCELVAWPFRLVGEDSWCCDRRFLVGGGCFCSAGEGRSFTGKPGSRCTLRFLVGGSCSVPGTKEAVHAEHRAWRGRRRRPTASEGTKSRAGSMDSPPLEVKNGKNLIDLSQLKLYGLAMSEKNHPKSAIRPHVLSPQMFPPLKYLREIDRT